MNTDDRKLKKSADGGEEHKKLLELRESEKRPLLSAKAKKELIDWVKAFAVALVAVLLIRTFLFTVIRVDGSSMNATLNDGDRLIVTRLDMWLGDPDRFDVVIVHYPNHRENYVKRVVGLPGETIEIKSGVLYIDGEKYDEPFLDPEIAAQFSRATYDYGPYTVPEGNFFVMGDNRVNSNDSRSVGSLAADKIIGRVRFVMFPFSSAGAVAGSEVYAEEG